MRREVEGVLGIGALVVVEDVARAKVDGGSGSRRQGELDPVLPVAGGGRAMVRDFVDAHGGGGGGGGGDEEDEAEAGAGTVRGEMALRSHRLFLESQEVFT